MDFFNYFRIGRMEVSQYVNAPAHSQVISVEKRVSLHTSLAV